MMNRPQQKSMKSKDIVPLNVYPACMDASSSSLLSAITLDRDLSECYSRQNSLRRFEDPSRNSAPLKLVDHLDNNDFCELMKPQRSLSRDMNEVSALSLDLSFDLLEGDDEDEHDVSSNDGGDDDNECKDEDKHNRCRDDPCHPKRQRYSLVNIIDRITEELRGEGSVGSSASDAQDRDCQRHTGNLTSELHPSHPVGGMPKQPSRFDSDMSAAGSCKPKKFESMLPLTKPVRQSSGGQATSTRMSTSSEPPAIPERKGSFRVTSLGAPSMPKRQASSCMTLEEAQQKMIREFFTN